VVGEDWGRVVGEQGGCECGGVGAAEVGCEGFASGRGKGGDAVGDDGVAEVLYGEGWVVEDRLIG
jgi:hypothetical protein